MKETNLLPHFYLVSDQSLPHHLEKDIQHHLSRQFQRITTRELIRLNSNEREHFIIVDLTAIEDIGFLQQTLNGTVTKRFLVLLNTQKHLTLSDVLKWQGLSGYFLINEDVEKIMMGIRCILRGQSWLPRETMTQVVEYYQSIEASKPTFEIELTRRELDVLQSLKSGASNLEIADELFISEHTIKSHLYNIFKKLDVKNRIQAMAWAKQHLPS
ncbi:putative Transcriptional regulator VpsT [Vibrio nigripulchritudo MADA3029]|uniref:LuxR C-terminal-related transcriptional regulator n=1 Tax=Vibrio nigripulchritudo TaxID=28173 RepID=UPI0003B202D4|nr:LuxR C-terminal-related transcriptional regulator [Vibrio nigripulchritudo]CCN49051.1 putative Transcriptional regulator VpsT [Vibrio nigripulchritudo MADA3020]CCN52667.1 putative Transcriptional regulator VpsT [Vibrio nigripulchritudo MADA3021]CCN61049.1 putative Transcriptional regulator VpsT [Vibrio nigripulchritudo MADA3029]BCL68501.1 helix-turn-helix transcriptional regulator [Vibrio nigripulchritudo]BDU29830.1 helix-turn-helix transcriptional regulator [Vibrio nigripulchritudo]